MNAPESGYPLVNISCRYYRGVESDWVRLNLAKCKSKIGINDVYCPAIVKLIRYYRLCPFSNGLTSEFAKCELA